MVEPKLEVAVALVAAVEAGWLDVAVAPVAVVEAGWLEVAVSDDGDRCASSLQSVGSSRYWSAAA